MCFTARNSIDTLQSVFHFKQFDVRHARATQKVTTDSVLLGAWMKMPPAVDSVLDVGAGMGLLALMMAQRCPGAAVTAIECDGPSAEECRLNFANSPWSKRLGIVEGDFIEWEVKGKYDVIVSNPPYFNEDTLSNSTQRNMARHESGLNIDSLIAKSVDILAGNGTLGLVCPWRERRRVRYDAEIYGFTAIRECAVVTVEGRPAALGLFQLWCKGDDTTETLVIRDAENNYTTQYIELTNDFYKFLH